MKLEQTFDKIYDKLVEIGGANESMRSSFLYAHLHYKYPCQEWRFIGHLGFGGKYRSTTNRVDCYSEDETPERLVIIEKLNAELSKIVDNTGKDTILPL